MPLPKKKLKILKLVLEPTSYDLVSIRDQIVSLLRRKKLLDPKFLYRGFPKKRLDYAIRVGMDHPLTSSTYANTLEELRGEPHENNVITFANDGGCLGVLSAAAFTQALDEAEYRAISTATFPLVAIIMLESDVAERYDTGAIEDDDL